MKNTDEQNKRVVALLNVQYSKGPQTEELPPPSGAGPSLVKELYQVYEGSSLRVGRAKTNDIVLNDRDVSRFHATFSASENGMVLSDLASTNGTFVNGRRITTPVDLMSGDVITLGNIRIDIQLHYTDDSTEHDGTRTALSDLQAVEVTVLLADVVAYTGISQNLPPDEVAKMLRVWFEMVGKIIEKHHGEIDKYIGDCVMALWRGTAKDSVEKATAAVEAGREIVEETKRLNESGVWSAAAQYPWICRAALNSGSALFGSVGAGDRRNYTVLGDAINVAFRIESLAGKLRTELIMSEHTAALVKARFPTKPLGSFDLEGRIGEMSVFSLA